MQLVSGLIYLCWIIKAVNMIKEESIIYGDVKVVFKPLCWDRNNVALARHLKLFFFFNTDLSYQESLA